MTLGLYTAKMTSNYLWVHKDIMEYKKESPTSSFLLICLWKILFTKFRMSLTLLNPNAVGIKDV